MAITLNSTTPLDETQKWASVQVEADGDKCNFNHVVPADLEGDDLQAYVDGREDFYRRELLRNMYPSADCYNSGLKEWDKWIAAGCKNAEITEERIVQYAFPAVDALIGTRQVVVESEVEEEVSKTEVALIDGRYVEQTTTETVTKTVSTPQFTEHQLYNEAVEAKDAVLDEDGNELEPAVEAVAEAPQTRVVTEAVEAKDAVLDEDGNELEPAVEAAAEVTEPILHSVELMENYEIAPATEAVEEITETVVVRPETVVEKVAWKDTVE